MGTSEMVPVDPDHFRVLSFSSVEYRTAFERLLNACAKFVENDDEFAREVFLAQEDIRHCVGCGRLATGWAFHGVDRLCHGEGRDCYAATSSRRAGLDELVHLSEDAGLYDPT